MRVTSLRLFAGRPGRLARLAAQEVATAGTALEVEAGGAWAHLAGEACRDVLQADVFLSQAPCS